MKCLSQMRQATDQCIWMVRISVRKLTQKCKRYQPTKKSTWASSTLFQKLWWMMTPRKKIVPPEPQTMFRPRIRNKMMKFTTHKKFKKELISLTIFSLILNHFQIILAQMTKWPIIIKLIKNLSKIYLKWPAKKSKLSITN